jgi:hypothetical protein
MPCKACEANGGAATIRRYDGRYEMRLDGLLNTPDARIYIGYGWIPGVALIVLTLLAVAARDIVLRNRRRRFERTLVEARRAELGLDNEESIP